MHAQVKQDTLLVRADNAIATARRLESELSGTVAAGYAQRRRLEHWQTLQSGLAPAIAISLRVRARIGVQGDAACAILLKSAPAYQQFPA